MFYRTSEKIEKNERESGIQDYLDITYFKDDLCIRDFHFFCDINAYPCIDGK